jgi:hypothetical protein
MSKQQTEPKANFTLEILTKYNKVRVTHVFQDNIERVFHMFRSIKHYKRVFKGFFEDIKCVKGDEKNFSTGSEYKSFWKETSNKIRVEDIKETENFKELHMVFYDIGPDKFRYWVTYRFYKSTTEEYTFWYYDLLFESAEALNYHKLNFSDSDCIKLFKNMDRYLYSNPEGLEQEESIVLNYDFKELWAIITDWKSFRQHVPIIADSVEFERGSDQRISLIKLHYSNDKSEYYLRVLKSELSDNSGDYELVLFSSNNSFASQEMRFKLLSLGEKSTMLIFKHVFSKYVKNKVIKDLSDNKREILRMLKKSLSV